MLSPPAKTGGDDDAAAPFTITVGDVTGRALGGLLRFVYSDTPPDFEQMDEEESRSSSSKGKGKGKPPRPFPA